MSDIIRRLAGITTRDQRVTGATTRTLAQLCHEAEDTGNDVLLCDVWAEVEELEARIPGVTNTFMHHYRELWAKSKEAT